ncbi:MAG: hypothetical protein CDV28_10116 [Candidatus Electronema aureum]|uniref:Zinc-or iron-chelating domain-containing protein n=1 Tax=Candidatus Electronema aureum TaxID=2005002 RepID=A0A521G5E0_9BACT|nr:MAG: hypothetical protein CDV28_10116 [Candidatus Electronema aureum]
MRVLLTLPSELKAELAAIYQALQEEYERVAERIPLTCHDCPDNCCDSWFHHHTYSEWAWLWQGLRQLDEPILARITARAEDSIRQSQEQLAAGQLPRIMCPLNEEGRCSLYEHRLLVCRMHGIPATLTRPDGKQLRFPGCFRCQEIVQENYRSEHEAPTMDRTQLFTQLAALESRLLGGDRQLYPKIKKTIAEMIVQGPPTFKL